MFAKKNKKIWIIVAGAAALLLIGGVFLYLNSGNKVVSTGKTPTPNVSTSPAPSVSPSATPGATATPTPDTIQKTTPTPSPTTGITVYIDSFTFREGGILRVVNRVVGATSGSCVLTLTDPNKQITKFNGTIIISGQSYICSLDEITGVNATGTWSATLAAASGDLSGSATKDFTK